MLLDEYIWDMDDDLFQKMKADKPHRWLVLPHFTSTAQPCDSGIDMLLKELLKV